MNWEALGAVAEMVGAAAVVITLAYLAAQIRRSNLLGKAESNRYSQHSADLPLMAIVQDSDVARIFREGLGDREALTPDDRVRFDMLVGSLVGAFTGSLNDQRTLDTEGAFVAADHEQNIRLFLSTPGGESWWAANRQQYARDVRSMVDQILQSSPTPAV